jgi:hypothetical protein
MEAGRYPAAERVSWENAVPTKAEPLSDFMEMELLLVAILYNLQLDQTPCAILSAPLRGSFGLGHSLPCLLFGPACPENRFPSSHDEHDRALDTEAIHPRRGRLGQFY